QTILNVGTITIGRPDPESFSVDPTPLILNPSESQALSVTFTPMFVGNFEAELLVASDAGSTSVQLLGAGIDMGSSRDSLALVDLYNSTDGPNWTNNSNWLSDLPLPAWFGVTVENDRVTSLDLSRNNLAGPLPSSIGDMGGLKDVFLQGNKLTGPIPPEIGNLTNLFGLRLAANQLTGSIPSEVGNLASLERLFLQTNQLSGSIPPEIGNLLNIQHFEVAGNQLTGGIPAEIGNPPNLTTILAANNQLSGEIPATIGNLSGLVNLDLASNRLTGNIPSEIGSLTNLVLLQFDANQLTGSIPAAIGNLVNLQFLFLNNNQLSGSIPIEIGNLTNLVDLFLAANQLSGPIPAEIGNLRTLARLTLELNELTGPIPSQIANLTRLTDLTLEINQLSGEIPAEIGNLVNLQILRLWDNAFTDAVPTELANLDNLEWLGIHDNRLQDLPDLSGLTALNRLEIENNLFTFEDIEPNIGIPGFTYSPQDSVGEERQETLLVGSSLTMLVSVGGANNRYQWLKDGRPIEGAVETSLSIATLDLADSGIYTCEITNTLATDLTLFRRPIRVDVETPTPVQVAVPAPPKPNTDQVLSITPPGNFQPTINEMFYRRAGEPSYQVTSLAASGNEFQGTIPSDFVTIRGLEYYISLSDGQVQVTFPPTDPVNNPAVLPVQLDRLNYPLPLQPETYKMISLPIELANTQIDSVLTDDYGPYDVLPRQWRLFRLENGSYAEYPNFNATLTNGLAFFLITRTGEVFDLENGQSANSGQPVVIMLQPGWNQIGNPFAFPISWGDIVVSGNVQGPVFFDGVEYQFVFGTLEPWEGYFVYNADLIPATLTVPAKESQAAMLKAASIFEPATETEYTLQLTATVPGMRLRDTQNYLGFRDDARQSMDQHDLLEPPSIGQHVRVTIVSEPHEFAANFKPHNELGQEWELKISSTLSRPTIRVALHKTGQLRDGHQLFLLDLDHRERLSTEDMAFTIELNRELPVRRLRVMIGTEAFAQQNRDGIPLIPLEFALEQNYPNPFNPETTIQYRLNMAGAVSLQIFNLLGQEIRTLIEEKQTAGVHSVTWDGLDNAGHPVASGVYVYRLTTATAGATRKLVLIR
ncbi:T9SS type A sorting domain-containing protein, partial [bacterium]|nr:T9SS type A sorting domain-containing protein [bacterium]